MDSYKNNLYFDAVVNKLPKYSSWWLVIFFTLIVSILSFFMVYACSVFFDEEYTNQLLRVSIVLPLLITPVTVVFLLKLAKYLKYFRDDLEKEVQENKKKDVLLFEQARFALMGEMIANISHQWKQPLNTINLAILSAKTSKLSQNGLAKHFDIMEDNVNYLATTIDDFMSFFDKRTHLELKSLADIVKEIKNIIQTHILNEDIELEININPNSQNIIIASSISQVILNLLSNSKDAFDKNIENKKITVDFKLNKRVLEITCADNAGGVPAEIENKIFDPYFTTKEKTQGTGIGLYMSKQIVQKLFNGTIGLNSKRDAYEKCTGCTCFYIDIPYSENCKETEESK